MRWFGGHTGGLTIVPAGARLLWQGRFPLWLVGDWAAHEVHTARGHGSAVAVLGSCDAKPAQIQALLTEMPAEPALTWPGCYTVVLARSDTPTSTLSVWTDVGGACPIYITAHGSDTVWGSSARALAALIGAQINND